MFSTLSFEPKHQVEVHTKMKLTKHWKHEYNSKQQEISSGIFGSKVRSRNGCLHCKKMKKKCDQLKPSCSMCNRKKVECVYVKRDSQRTNSVPTTVPQEMSPKLDLPVDLPVEEIPSIFDFGEGQISLTPPFFYRMSASSSSLALSPIIPDSVVGIDKITTVDDADDEEIPMDDSQVVENQQTRDGLLDEEEMFSILWKIIKGEESGKRYWVAPNRVAYFKEFRKVYEQSNNLPRSPLSSNILMKLDELGMLFFENYHHIVVEGVSVSPRASDNYFRSLFIPMAEYDDSILYALTGWGGMAIAGRHSKEAQKYMMKAQLQIADRLKHVNEELQKDVLDRNISGTDLLIVLSVYLISLGAEISTGDVDRWTSFMKSSYKILSKIGLKNFLLENFSKEALWLISNFFYHDITHFSGRATSFPIKDYEEVLLYGGHVRIGLTNEVTVDYGVDPLNGCNTALLLIKGEIVNLHYGFAKQIAEFEKMEEELLRLCKFNDLDNLSRRQVDDITELNFKRELLLEEWNRICDELEAKINNVKPAVDKLANVKGSEIEVHLTSFELVQLSLKLFVNLLLRKKPPVSRDIQMLLVRALDDIKILVGTKVESSLGFPLMMLSLSCYKEYDRYLIRDFFRKVINSTTSTFVNLSLERCSLVLKEYWRLNPSGLQTMNWYDIIEDLQWELSLL